jgi:hypothetical protein
MGNALLTGIVFVAILSTWAAIVAAVLLHAASNPRSKAQIAALLSRPAPIEPAAAESDSRPLAG